MASEHINRIRTKSGMEPDLDVGFLNDGLMDETGVRAFERYLESIPGADPSKASTMLAERGLLKTQFSEYISEASENES